MYKVNNFSSSVVSRFLEYIQYDTQSNEETTIYPSSVGQKELQKKTISRIERFRNRQCYFG